MTLSGAIVIAEAGTRPLLLLLLLIVVQTSKEYGAQKRVMISVGEEGSLEHMVGHAKYVRFCRDQSPTSCDCYGHCTALLT